MIVKFNRAQDVIDSMKQNVNYPIKNVLILGTDKNIGFERNLFDFSKIENVTIIEWADANIKSVNKFGLKNVKVIKGMVQDFEKLTGSVDFDYVCLIEILEHLTKSDGLKLLDNLKKHSKNILIYSPVQPKLRDAEETKNQLITLGRLDISVKPDLECIQNKLKENNDVLSTHLSLWKPDELEDIGFKTYFDIDYNQRRRKGLRGWGAFVAVYKRK